MFKYTNTHTNIHTHTHIYIYIYIYIDMHSSSYKGRWLRSQLHKTKKKKKKNKAKTPNNKTNTHCNKKSCVTTNFNNKQNQPKTKILTKKKKITNKTVVLSVYLSTLKHHVNNHLTLEENKIRN